MNSPYLDYEIDWMGDTFKPVLKFLMLPGLFLVPALLLGDGMPVFILYGFAALFGLALIFRAASNIEYLLASFIFYIPLSKLMPISVLPGINGTNFFFLMIILFMLFQPKEKKTQQGLSNKLLLSFGFLSTFSGVTALFNVGSLHLFSYYILEYKAWVDQFIFMLVFSRLIKDREMAVRLMGYMLVACFIVTVLGFQEAMDKMGRASIDASRVDGPMMQPNNFAAFMVYTVGPVFGLALMWMKSAKVLVLGAYLLLWLRVLLATFSRGALLGFLCAGIILSYVRGIRFSIIAGFLGVSILIINPQLIPDSITDRFSSTENTENYEMEGLDKSSHSRLVIWRAALKITQESPILGKGFKVFPVIMGDYLDEAVEETDPHNMYFYMSTQMGVPCVILFVAVMAQLFFRGRGVYNHYKTPFVKAVGIGAAFTSVGVLVVNVFGSRMVNLEVTAFVWMYCIVIAKLSSTQEIEKNRMTVQ